MQQRKHGEVDEMKADLKFYRQMNQMNLINKVLTTNIKLMKKYKSLLQYKLQQMLPIKQFLSEIHNMYCRSEVYNDLMGKIKKQMKINEFKECWTELYNLFKIVKTKLAKVNIIDEVNAKQQEFNKKYGTFTPIKVKIPEAITSDRLVKLNDKANKAFKLWEQSNNDKAKLKTAIKCVDQILKEYPSDWNAMWRGGSLNQHEMGDDEKALEVYEIGFRYYYYYPQLVLEYFSLKESIHQSADLISQNTLSLMNGYHLKYNEDAIKAWKKNKDYADQYNSIGKIAYRIYDQVKAKYSNAGTNYHHHKLAYWLSCGLQSYRIKFENKNHSNENSRIDDIVREYANELAYMLRDWNDTTLDNVALKEYITPETHNDNLLEDMTEFFDRSEAKRIYWMNLCEVLYEIIIERIKTNKSNLNKDEQVACYTNFGGFLTDIKGEYRRALELHGIGFDEMKKAFKDPFDETLWFNIAECYEKQGNLKQALKWYNELNDKLKAKNKYDEDTIDKIKYVENLLQYGTPNDDDNKTISMESNKGSITIKFINVLKIVDLAINNKLDNIYIKMQGYMTENKFIVECLDTQLDHNESDINLNKKLLALGALFYESENYTKSIQLLQKCQKISIPDNINTAAEILVAKILDANNQCWNVATKPISLILGQWIKKAMHVDHRINSTIIQEMEQLFQYILSNKEKLFLNHYSMPMSIKHLFCVLANVKINFDAGNEVCSNILCL